MALLRRPIIRRCSAASRSFLLAPAGAAGAPPGHRLRAGTLATTKERHHNEHRPDGSAPSQFGDNTASTRPGGEHARSMRSSSGTNAVISLVLWLTSVWPSTIPLR